MGTEAVVAMGGAADTEGVADFTEGVVASTVEAVDFMEEEGEAFAGVADSPVHAWGVAVLGARGWEGADSQDRAWEAWVAVVFAAARWEA